MSSSRTNKKRLSFVSLLMAIVLLLRPVFASANPEGGVVAAGQANIITAPTTVDIHQQTHKVVIDWRSFDIAPNERTEFHQPSASAIALNRVNSPNASAINGTLKANGNIIIVNQNGVLFGREAKVDVNGLVATSADTTNDRFMNESKVTFDKAGSSDAVVSNEGSITAKESGLVGFVAPRVENSGVITARLGRVQLASGEKATVDFYGDGLLEVAVGAEVTHQLAKNTGTINAQGGTIALTAAAGRKLLSSGIEVGGALNAQTVSQREGKIIIAAAGKNAVVNNIAANKNGSNSNVASSVTVKGKLHASGNTAGERGGTITITGDEISLKSGTNISAIGAAGGGVIRIGGEYLGQGSTPTARNATVESGALIDASATEQGHGGEVILFADGDTIFNGLIYANGAGVRGNGGFVETSGKSRLHIGGMAHATASNGGLAGQWLLDPADITITAATNSNITGATPFTATNNASQLSAATIVAALNLGTNVTVQTNNDAFAGNGDIFVNSAITSTGAGALTISAFRNILVNAAISLNGGALTLRSDNTGSGSGAISTSAAISTNGGDITIGGGSGAITAATYNANGSIATAASGFARGNATLTQGVTIGGAINSGNNGNIIINGRGFSGTATSVGVEQSAGNAITASGTGSIRISGINQGTAANANQANGVVLRNTVTTQNGVLQVNGQGGGGTDTTSNAGILISSTGGVLRSTGTGAITVSGVGGTSSGGNNFGVLVNNASGISPTGSGTVLLYGLGGTAGAQNIGVAVNQAGTGSVVGGGGAITINGFGGNTAGGNNHGVALVGTGAGIGVVSNSGTGTITVTGTGAGSGAAANNYGVLIGGTGARFSSSGTGAVSITGTGGGGTGGSNYGVIVNTANGITTSAGAPISITGQGGSAGANAVGVIVGSVASITAGSSAVTINGTGGASNGSSSHGVQFNGGGAGTGALTTSGAVNITGTGGGGGTTNNNHGIFLSGTGATIAKTGAGAYTLTGTGGTGSGGSNHGIYSNIADGITSAANATLNATAGSGANSNGIVSDVANGIRTTGAATLTLFSNSFNIAAASAVNSITTLTVAPLTAVTFGLGTGAGVANITNASLNNLAATTGYIFGSATTPDITVNTTAPFTSRALTFISSGNITLTNAFDNLTSLTTTAPTGTTTLNGILGGTTAIGSYSATGRDLAINANLISNSNITAAFTRDITIGAGATITSGAASALSLQAAGGNTAGTGNLTINGNLSVGTGNLTLLSGANGTRPSFTATATNLIRQGATFGVVSIRGFQDLLINRDINSSAGITLFALRDLTLNAVNTLTTGAAGGLDLQAAGGNTGGTGNLTINGNLSSGTGNVTMRSGQNGTRPNYTITATNFVPQSTFGTIDIQGFQDTTINRDITSSGSITVVSRRDLTLNAANTLTTGAAGGLTLQAANNVIAGTGNLNLNGTISVGTGALTLRSGVNGTRPNWTATATNLVLQGATVGAVNIDGFLDTVIDRNLPSSGAITIVGFRDLTVNTGRTVISGAASGLNLQAANGLVGGVGRLNLDGTLSNGTGGLTLISGTNVTRPTYTATTTNLVRQGATFGALSIQGFANFTVDRVLNSSSAVNFSNNTLTTLRNNVTSTGSAITFTANPIVVAEGFSPTISTVNANITLNSIADTAGGVTEGLTLSAGTGTITSGATIDGVALNANAGTITLTGVLGGVRALGNSVITATANQLTLPTITALSLNASTTGAGTNQLNISGPITTTGASGLTLTSSGSIAKTGAGDLSSGTGPMVLNATGAIHFASAATNLNSTGANITLTSPVGIVNTQSLTVNTANGNLSYGGPVIVGAPLTLNLGTGAANFSSTINGTTVLAAFDVLAVGAGGGGGGADGLAGGGGGGGAAVDTRVNVVNGATYTVGVGGGGGGATASVSNNGRGAAGANGGGIGGHAGTAGNSGGGGGGGGFSGVAIGGTFYAVAGGGAGGGGSNEGTANDVQAPGGGSQPNGNTGTTSGGAAANFGAGDGGGGGGGGGGFLGGNGQTALTTSGQASGGSNYTNPANSSATITNGNNGNTQAAGAAGGAVVSIAAPRATYYGYTGAGAGGNGVPGTNGTNGGNGVVIIRYTGSAALALATGTFTSTTIGGDTLITYNSGTTNSFVPLTACSGNCNLTINAGNVNFAGTIGTTAALDALSVNATNGFILPTTVAGSVAATGRTYLNGNITTSNGNVTFNSPLYVIANSAINAGTGTVTFASTVDALSAAPSAVQALVVAGGGGGGANGGGGGGAGGLQYNPSIVIANGVMQNVIVGAGGAGAATQFVRGSNGGNSSFAGITSLGGGGGASRDGGGAALSGGSGGGGGGVLGGNAAGATAGTGTAGQGNNGSNGTAADLGVNAAGGGGGGAGGLGTAGASTVGGNGGAGLSNSITGSAVVYAGGGAGGVTINGSGGTGGLGGGGDGGRNAIAGVNGTANTGGGGGGGGPILSGSPAGAGGSGVVIVRYTGTTMNAIVVGGTSTTVGADTVWTFNSNGSFTPVGCTGSCGLTVNGGAITFGGAVGGTTPLGASAFTSSNALNLAQNIVASSILARTTGATSDITIAPGIALSASGTGDAITLASGRDFINNSGLGLATLNTTGGGRYLIYSVQPSSDTTGGLVRDFRRFSCSFASVGSCLFNATINNTVTIPGTGNGFIYSSTPGTLTLSISSIGNVIYGNSVNLVGLATDPTTLGQYLNASDFANDIITGSITGSTTYVPGPTNGGLGTYNINYASGALVSELGYNINYANNPTAFTVVPRTVTVGLVGPISRVYDGSLAATLAGSNYSISNVFAGDVLGISNTSGAYDTRNAGTGKTVTVTGLNLTGAPVANYVLSSTTAVGAVGTITARALTIGATGINRIYDGLLGATVTLNDDRVAGDTLTTGYTAANFGTKDVGTGKTVTVTGISLGGTDAGNYTFNTSTTTTADITQRALTIGATGINRIYNGLLGATVTLNDDRVAGDTLTTGYTAANFGTKDVGTGKTVTVTGISLGGTDAGNYTFNTSTTTTADITQRALTIGATGINRIYNGLLGATVTLNDDRVAGDTLTTGYTTASFGTKDVGTGKTVTVTGISLGGTDAGNYTFNTSTTTTADITQRALTIGATGINRIYNGLLGATVTLNDDRVAGDTLTTGYIAANFGTKDVGTGKTVTVTGITLSGTDAGNYTFNTSTTTTADITQRALTIAATALNKVYDGNTTTVASLTDNRVAGDVLTTGYSAADFADKNAGAAKTVTITGITLGGGDAGNYTFNTSATTTADITQRLLTVTANPQAIIYGTAAPAGTISYGGFITGEDASFLATAPTVSSALSGIQDAGTYAGNYTASGGVDGNYSFTYVAGNLTVLGKILNVTADTKTIEYGTAVPAGTLIYNGFITGQDASFLITAPTVSSGLSGVQIVGTYTNNFTPSGGVSGNYIFNYVSGDLIVTRKNLNVSADNKSVNYGIAVPVGTLTYSGFIAGEDASFLTTAPTVSSNLSGIQNAGTYTGNYTASGGVSSNYNFIYTPGTFTVTPTGLNVTVGNRTVTYGVAVPTTTLVYTGFVTGEDETFLTAAPTISSLQSGIVGAGTYTGNYVASGGVSANYAFNYVAGDLTVTPKALNVTVGSQTVTYGTPVPTSSLAYTGFIAGEDETFLSTAPTISSSLSGIQNVGTYTGNYTAAGGVSANYTFNYVPGNLVVGKKDLLVTANHQNITYGMAVPVGTLTYSGFITGENASFLTTAPTVSSGLSGIQNAGTYAGNYAVAGGVASNYSFTYNVGDLLVSPAPLNIAASGINRTYGAANSFSGYLSTGLQNGETIGAVTLSSNATLSGAGLWNVGNWLITPSAATGGTFNPANYSITYQQGPMTITTRALTIGAAGITRVYNGLLGVTVTLNDDRVAGDTLTTGYTAANFGTKDVGTGKAVTVTGITLGGADAGNYSFNTTTSTTADITRRALTIGAVAANKVFDGTTLASVTLNDNRVSGDTLITGFGTANFATNQPATGITVTVTGITLGGTDAGNYTFNTTAFATADITGIVPPPPPAMTMTLPNTVVRVTQNTSDAVTAPTDDGVYASPVATYQLVYLPANAPLENRMLNRPSAVGSTTTPLTTAFVLPDEEKRLRNARNKRSRSLLARGSRTFIFDANIPTKRRLGGFEASPSAKSI